MVVMAAVYAQWYSVSGGLGGQQTYTEERSAAAADHRALALRGVVSLSTPALEPEALAVTSSQPPLPTYFPPTLYPTLGNSQTSLGNSQSLVEAATVRVASQGGQLTEAEMRALLAEAGAPAEWVPDMLTIAWCESHYSPGAVGDSGNSLGLFQLWSGWARPGEDLFDPLTNARVAVRVREIRGRFGGGGGWSCADLNGIS